MTPEIVACWPWAILITFASVLSCAVDAVANASIAAINISIVHRFAFLILSSQRMLFDFFQL
jgi:hypothetical protein